MKQKLIILTILIGLIVVFFPAPKARAMDPVTIALLTPVALEVAERAHPYIIKGMQGGLKGFMQMGGALLEIFLLPWGVVQATLGLPFGGLGPGIKNVALGTIAPLKLAFHTAILPLYFFGLSP